MNPMARDSEIYDCDSCGHRYVNRHSFTQHIRAQHPTVAYRCMICNSSTPDVRLFYRHMQQRHGLQGSERDAIRAASASQEQAQRSEGNGHQRLRALTTEPPQGQTLKREDNGDRKMQLLATVASERLAEEFGPRMAPCGPRGSSRPQDRQHPAFPLSLEFMQAQHFANHSSLLRPSPARGPGESQPPQHSVTLPSFSNLMASLQQPQPSHRTQPAQDSTQRLRPSRQALAGAAPGPVEYVQCEQCDEFLESGERMISHTADHRRQETVVVNSGAHDA